MTAHRRGTLTVADRVVRKIAEEAAREAVVGHGGSVTRGSATVRGQSARVGVDVTLPYRGSAGETARAVQEHMTARTSHLTGMSVPGSRIRIRELATVAALPVSTDSGDEAAPTTAPTTAPATAPARRWSVRRLPVAAVAVLVLAGAGRLLWDRAATQQFGDRGAPWRRPMPGGIIGSGPDGLPPWAAVVLAAAGLWMITMALTPGHRRDLALTAPGPAVRAVISRRSAGRLVRAALETQVPGMRGVRVRVRRRRLRVRVELAYADQPLKPELRELVTQAVTTAVRDLGPARAPRVQLRIRVRGGRSPRGEPAAATEQEG
ncbi:DUF6286 domain-containing protein [Streptomyces sp. AP-93]|uniref:DUF6286 domain-containing protein n=1 Tax=Streptomyces sp. AP-93 TaxID=2929048 RepID=UPI001FAFDAE4|nr:DUF6286 domain-containing Asp23/Gls24 family envelope stress response protein [Streptomyces sp. AP-93]MCJ0872660.1 Asp23/Gls24 family envelope stress response protein [Streptomyces sp. AP-93]